MARQQMNGQRVHVMLTIPQVKKVQRLARRTGLSVSELMRRAVDAFLSTQEQK